MNDLIVQIFASFFSGLFVGSCLFLLYTKILSRKHAKDLQKKQDLILNRAQSSASKIERLSHKKAKDYEEKARKDFEKEIRTVREDLKNKDYKIKQKEEQLQKELTLKEEEFKKKETELSKQKELVVIGEKNWKLWRQNQADSRRVKCIFGKTSWNDQGTS